MKTILRACAPLLVLLAACEETEESLEIAPDGSVTVVLTARGDPPDLVTGYPLPIDPRFAPRSAATEDWLREVEASFEPPASWRPPEDVELRMSARLDSVAELPRWYAPADHPYRTAFLRRDTRLDVRQHPDRTVYVFERTYGRRSFAGRERFETLGERIPEELQHKLDEKLPLDEADLQWFVDEFTAIYREGAEVIARDALVQLYTEGDAPLPARTTEAILADAVDAVVAVVSREKLSAVLAATRAEGEADDSGEQLEAMEEQARQALRDTLARGLNAAGLEAATRNAVLARLEWSFTDWDHTDDLGDQEIRLRVRLPGRIVGGNWDALEGEVATWKLKGDSLRERDAVLRAVSVLE